MSDKIEKIGAVERKKYDHVDLYVVNDDDSVEKIQLQETMKGGHKWTISDISHPRIIVIVYIGTQQLKHIPQELKGKKLTLEGHDISSLDNLKDIQDDDLLLILQSFVSESEDGREATEKNKDEKKDQTGHLVNPPQKKQAANVPKTQLNLTQVQQLSSAAKSKAISILLKKWIENLVEQSREAKREAIKTEQEKKAEKKRILKEELENERTEATATKIEVKETDANIKRNLKGH